MKLKNQNQNQNLKKKLNGKKSLLFWINIIIVLLFLALIVTTQYFINLLSNRCLQNSLTYSVKKISRDYNADVYGTLYFYDKTDKASRYDKYIFFDDKNVIWIKIANNDLNDKNLTFVQSLRE